MTGQRRVNGSRLGRLAMLGRLAGGIAGGALGEGTRRLASGERPRLDDLLLTPANARRIADRLAEMRGAAMKVGQLLSLDSGQVLPAQFAEVLERLRADAHPMPIDQVGQVLGGAFGSEWTGHFERFAFQPIAAASIGQVHAARLRDGRRVAVKLQYPGIRASIDSDVDNVATLLSLFRLLPEGMDVAPLLDEAKQQLHAEADYRSEADALRHFASLLADDPRFVVPGVIDALSSRDVLTMGYLEGDPIEALADLAAPQRDHLAGALLDLALREVFDWGWVQTDPNFANYLLGPDRTHIGLLDFGAARAYPADQRGALRALLHACIDGEDADVAHAAGAVGYLGDGDPTGYRDAVVALLREVTTPARHAGPFVFGRNDLAGRVRDQVIALRMRQRYARLPPPAVLFLHRKLGGLYLLLARIGARIDVPALLADRVAPPLSAIG